MCALWAADAEALRVRLDTVLTEPVPPALAQLAWRKAPETLPAVRWQRWAALAHTVYVPEVRHAVEVKTQEIHLSRWPTKRLTVPVKLFDLRAQGFELVGGRLLPDAGRGDL